MNLRNLDLWDFISSNIVKKCPTSIVSMNDDEFWNQIKNIVYVTFGSK